MYVRISPVSIDQGREPEVTQVTNEFVIPLLRGLPGFRRYHGAVDTAQGTGLAISYWETREQAVAVSEAVRSLGPQLQAAGIRVGPPAIYEVVTEA